MKDASEFVILDQPRERAQRRVKPLVGADAEHHTRSLAGAGCPQCFGLGQGQRLFAKDMLARCGGGENLATVQRMRCRQHDRVNARVRQRRRKIVSDGEPVLRHEIEMRSRSANDSPGKPQPAARALNSLDQGPAPAAETDDGRVDHRPAGWAPALIRCEARRGSCGRRQRPCASRRLPVPAGNSGDNAQRTHDRRRHSGGTHNSCRAFSAPPRCG